ncbi:MAG: hypothetical protein O8C64_11355 [Candidatus Methanoperedens sp.]|nr:hypothetical protein [Candidatus Methanoperedens sp.]MCZ7405458.1 hypothetical protein [Candidatus Methanoperedens sp.]
MTVEIKAPEKIKRGEVLEGTVIITLDKDVKFRDIIISFDNTITYPNPCTKNFSGWNMVSTSQQNLDKSGILLNAAIPFKFSIPREAPPSYKGEQIESTWKLNVKIDVPLAFDIHAEKYVEVER